MTDKTTTGSDAVDLDKSRAEFEAWVRERTLSEGHDADYPAILLERAPETHHSYYVVVRIQSAWEAWQAAMIAQARAAAPTVTAEKVETGMAERLRRIVACHGDKAVGVHTNLLTQAADECDRFYNGMMAWKRTAQAKDREFAEARAAAPAAIPEGFVLAPTDPPLKMAKAFRDADVKGDRFIDGYRAMLAAAPVIGASTAPTDEQIEAAAKAIYERFLGSEAHPWVERGNSIKQDDARYYARAALKAASLGASTATGEPVATFPERDPSKPAEQQGLFRKFEVRRVDGSDQPGRKHYGCRYYVLDLNHDQHAPAAMRAYAASCRVTHPQLADDIEAEFAAPAPQQAAPLTAERIEQIWDEVPLTGAYTMAEARIKFARAIERELSAGSAASAGDATQAARDVLAERRRQVEAEGWTPEHDDMHGDGQIAVAAGHYALACGYPHERDIGRGHVPTYWPWAPSWWKPSTKRRNLIKAGALIIAEIERIDRAAMAATKEKKQ